MASTTIPVIRIQQRGVTVYVGRMTAAELLEHAYVHEWNPAIGWNLADPAQGYQRQPIRDHYRGIAEFLKREGDPLMPTAALLSARESELGKLPYRAIKRGSVFGHLRLPEGRQLVIVVYQHRWHGLEYAINTMGIGSLGEFAIPVIVLADASRFEEMRQFYLVNSKQRRVDTDLALTLMHAMSSAQTDEQMFNLVGPGSRYKIRGTRILVSILQRGSGPWHDRVQEPNMPTDPARTASMKSFVDSLRPLISNRSPIHRLNDDDFVKVLLVYWEGILEAMPQAAANPRGFAVQKSVGLFVLHRVAAGSIFRNYGDPLRLSSADVASAISGARSFMTPGFWATGGSVGQYSSGAAHKELADQIMSAL